MSTLLPVEALAELSAPEFGRALTPLFETAEPLARALYAERPFASYAGLIDHAEALALALPDAERVEVVNAHPRIGESAARMSPQSAREQGATGSGVSDAELDQDQVYADLARLNAEYEARFGFRFVVFVNGRPRSAIRDVLAERLSGPRDQELATGLREMFAIARDRLHGMSS